MNGASARIEFLYFLFDSVIIFLVALVLSICIIELIFPSYQQLIERALDKTLLYSPDHIVPGIAIVIALGLLAGLYPAFILISNKRPDDQDIWKDFKKIGVFFDSKLIIIQFALCIFFLIGSIFVYKQFRYMDQLIGQGFNKEKILLIKNPWYLGSSHDAFKQTLFSHSNIMQVSSSESVPGINNFSVWGHPVDSAIEDCHITVIYCDYEYLNTLDMNLNQGRFFDRSHSTDNLGIVLNETAIKRLGWTEPIGKRYRLDTVYRVIGVVKDIHYESLHNTIEPMGMVLISPGSESFISVRIGPSKTEDAVSFVADTWESFAPDRPLEYSFMDKEYDSWYNTDRKVGVITSLMSIMAIIISSLGLMGLMAFTILRRTKEIGIRKVNGATSTDIHILFIKDSSKWILLALIIATPSSYFALRKWLQGFAYKTEISWWLFFLAGFIVYFIALCTILWQSQKAARQSTIDSLRYE
jgi:putative ABC transport system permease protein